MPNAERASEPRLCSATTEVGTLCRSWAMRRDPLGRCWQHAGADRGPRRPRTCKCGAYRFPHRPGGGDCPWPDPYPGDERDE